MEIKLIEILKKKVKSKSLNNISMRFVGRDVPIDDYFELRSEIGMVNGRPECIHRIFPTFSLSYKVGWLLNASVRCCMNCDKSFGISTWKVSSIYIVDNIV